MTPAELPRISGCFHSPHPATTFPEEAVFEGSQLLVPPQSIFFSEGVLSTSLDGY